MFNCHLYTEYHDTIIDDQEEKSNLDDNIEDTAPLCSTSHSEVIISAATLQSTTDSSLKNVNSANDSDFINMTDEV